MTRMCCHRNLGDMMRPMEVRKRAMKSCWVWWMMLYTCRWEGIFERVYLGGSVMCGFGKLGCTGSDFVL